MLGILRLPFLSYTLSRRSNSMKRCPKCHFSFADFHRVCAFDGSPLLEDSQRPPSFVKDRSPRTRFRRVPKLQLFPDGVAVVALLASALLIRYYHSPRESNSMVALQASQNAFVSPASPAKDVTRPPVQHQAQKKVATASTRAAVPTNSKRTESVFKRTEKSASPARREATVSRQQATASRRGVTASRQKATASPLVHRFNSPDSADNQVPKWPAARPTECEDAADRKQPKLLAMLKTTWRVLKKPFKF